MWAYYKWHSAVHINHISKAIKKNTYKKSDLSGSKSLKFIAFNINRTLIYFNWIAINVQLGVWKQYILLKNIIYRIHTLNVC